MIRLQADELSEEYMGQSLLYQAAVSLYIPKAQIAGMLWSKLEETETWRYLFLEFSSPITSFGISVSYLVVSSKHQPLLLSPKYSKPALHPAYNAPTAEYEHQNAGNLSILGSCHSVKLHSCFKLFPTLHFTSQAPFLVSEYLICLPPLPPFCKTTFFLAWVLSGATDLEAPQLQQLFLWQWHLKRQQQLPIKGLCHLFPLPLLWDSSSYIQKNIYHSSFTPSLKNEQEENVFFHGAATALQKPVTLSLRKRATLESKRKQQKTLMIDPSRPCILKAILGGICIRKGLFMSVWKAKVRARPLHFNHQSFMPATSEKRCTCVCVHTC